NALELLHVSGYRPHELTQQFITVNGGNSLKHQQYAPWQNPNAMVYRALELMGVPSYMAGTTNGGRVPGRININTMNELEIWQALCDRQAISTFTDADVATLYGNLIGSRSPHGTPGATDRPFP